MTYANVTATAAMIAAVGGGALASGAIPDAEDRIPACYVPKTIKHKVKGKLRVVKSAGAIRLLVKGSRCPKGERKLSWAQRGPAGAMGPAGASGPPGPGGGTNVVRRILTGTVDPNESSFRTLTVPCVPGEVAIGGGAGMLAANGAALTPVNGDALLASVPRLATSGDNPPVAVGRPTAWTTTIHNGGSSRDAVFYALCASP